MVRNLRRLLFTVELASVEETMDEYFGSWLWSAKKGLAMRSTEPVRSALETSDICKRLPGRRECIPVKFKLKSKAHFRDSSFQANHLLHPLHVDPPPLNVSS